MTFYRRRLPHLYESDRAIFLTWCLHKSLPENRPFPPEDVSPGEAFAFMDRLLDRVREGSFYLRQPAIADMVVEVVHYHAEQLKRFQLHSFVVMPNHVHLLIRPLVPLPKVTKALKGYTAKLANQMLNLTGTPFWQDESYDHMVRNDEEFARIRRYIEMNPVRAGLVSDASTYRWSSARSGDPAVACRPGGLPHTVSSK